MFSKAKMVLISFLIALGLLMPGLEKKAEAKQRKKKVGFFEQFQRKIKRDFKRSCKKTKRAIVKAGAAVQDKIMDGAVKAKSAITGKKPKKVWVRGHYSKGHKSLTNGHFRRVKRHHHSSGGTSSGGGAPEPAPTPTPTPAPAPAPAPSAPGVSVGNPLPPVDPALPTTVQKSVRNRR
jgi:hypothetical protein